MTASLLDGRFVAAQRREELKRRVALHVQQGQNPPGLAVILLGHDAASVIYVSNKCKACEEVGIVSYSFDLSLDTSQEELLNLIEQLNNSAHISGILVQLPLPKHIDERVIIEMIKPEKDVDGFHPYNLGRLSQRNPLLRPCTPLGIMALLRHYHLEVKRKHAVIIGASNIVGRPMSMELLLEGATVTICHRFTQDLEKHVSIADILIVAAGKMNLIHHQWLQEHQIVIDVGIHRLSDGSIRGDVDFNQAASKVAWITPVPGGVGPMTIVSLLENTMMAAQLIQA